VKLSAALLALSLAAPVSPGLLSIAPVAAQESEATSLTPAQAEAATKLLLSAIEKNDAAAVHSKLADSIKNSVSVEAVQKRLDSDLAISSSRVVKVGSGYSDTTVDALITTAEGDLPVLLILDEEGKLLAWKIDGKDIPIEATAQSFTEELAAGRWVQARSRLQIDFQKELAPGDLERKWTKLTKLSGGFRNVKDAVVASQGGEQQLVLVCVEFGKATTNLFVIFDDQGRIINVDISRDFV
jgi:hypothetical protein